MIRGRDLIGRLIVTVTHGEIVGKVKDVLIDPDRFEIAALVLPTRGLKKTVMVLPRGVIHMFGKDVVLVKSNEAMPRDNTLSSVASLIAVSGEMKGRQVATEKGVRVGLLNDVLVDEDGKVVGWDLSKVFITGPVAESKQIPFGATRSVGPDLIIVDADSLESL